MGKAHAKIKFSLVLLLILSVVGFCFVIKGNNKTATASAPAWDGSTTAGFSGTGLNDDPYIISTGENLAYLSQEVNAGNNYSGKYFKLSSDIDLGDHSFTPIGKLLSGTDYPFKGIFDGNGNTISNLNVNSAEAYVGLFGEIEDAIIENLNVEGEVVSSESNTITRVGGIVGYSYGTSQIMNCKFEGSIEAIVETFFVYCGGIVGDNDGTVIDCQVNANVSAFGIITVSAAGGIGGNNNGVVENCFISGEFEISSGRNAGGIAGNNGGIINACFSSGIIVEANISAGGIVGNNGGNVTSSFSTGTLNGVSDNNNIGGIVGFNNNGGEITYCYSLSRITLPASKESINAGGLVGRNNSATIENCYFAGNIIDAGSQYSSIGLIGTIGGTLTISNLYYDNGGVGTNSLSGGTGLTTLQMIGDTFNSSFVFSDITAWSLLGKGAYDNVTGKVTYYYPQLVVFAENSNNIIRGLSLQSAKIEFDAYEIEFDSQGGSLVESIYDALGRPVTMPADPTKTGYTFSEWNTQADGEGDAGTTITTMPENGATLYAQWTANTYTVTFNYNGATSGNSTADKSVTYDSTYGTLPSPSKAGYAFGGWYLDDGFTGTEVVSATAVTTASNHNLYAKWTAQPQTLTYKPGTDVTTGDEYVNSVNTGAQFTVLAYNDGALGYSKDDFEFVYWEDQYGIQYQAGDLVYMPAGGLTFTAIWIKGPQPLTYNPNSGTGTLFTTNIALDGEFEVFNYNNSNLNFSKAGYLFIGWNAKSDGSGTSYNVGESYMMIDGGITLYAQWQAVPQTLKYNAGVGTGTEYTTSSVNTDATFTAFDYNNANLNYSKAGYAFTGWKDQYDNTYSANATVTMLAGGLVLTAQWTAQSQTLVYKAGSGTGTEYTASSVNTDVTFTAFEYNNVNLNYSKAGYSFTGWNTKADGSGTDYAAGETITMPAGGITLYAQWQAEIQTLIYSDGSSVPGESIDEQYRTDISFTVKGNDVLGFTRSGRTFMGWNTESDGSGNDYIIGQTYQMPAGGITLYAQWKIIITFNSNGGSLISNKEIDDPEAIDELDFTTSRTGHTFAGWYTSSTVQDETTLWDFDEDVTESMTLYAKWAANKYVISFNLDGFDSITVTYNSTYGDLPIASKTGYNFDGWFTEDGILVTSSSQVSITKNQTLNAKFTIITITIIFDNNGTTKSQSLDYGSVLVKPDDPSRFGYSFKGWYIDSDCTTLWDFDKEVTSNMPLYAGWEVNMQLVYIGAGAGAGVIVLLTLVIIIVRKVKKARSFTTLGK